MHNYVQIKNYSTIYKYGMGWLDAVQCKAGDRKFTTVKANSVCKVLTISATIDDMYVELGTTRFHTTSCNVELFEQPSLKKQKAAKAEADDADDRDTPAQDAPIEYVDNTIDYKVLQWEQVSDKSGLTPVKDMMTSSLLRLSLLRGGVRHSSASQMPTMAYMLK